VLAAALGAPEQVTGNLLAWAEERDPAPKTEAHLAADFLHKDRYFWRRVPMPAWIPLEEHGHG
jgi:hypothetical protein